MNLCCATLRMFVPLRVLTLRTLLFVYMYSQVYMHAFYYWYSCIWTDVVQTYICLCPCECSHLEPLVCMHIVTSIQILLYITDTLVYEPKLRNSHLFVPCKCSRLEPLCLRTHILISIRLAYNRYSCIWTHVVRTHVCLSPCDCSHLEPLCIHTYAHKYAYIISQILLYINPCCALSYLFVPLQALTRRTFLYTYIYSQVLVNISYHG